MDAVDCPPCTEEYGFIGLNSEKRSPADIIGSKASISFHNVEFCNENEYDPSEPQSRPYNHSCVWTMIIGDNPNVSPDDSNVFIQTGWIRSNREGEPASNFVYFEAGTEINGVTEFLRWLHPYVAPSGTQEYRLEQADKANGTWEIYYQPNTAPWETRSFEFWENINGTYIQNQGEVNLLESDMPGLPMSRCVLKNLQFLEEGVGGWQDQDTQNNTVGNKTKFGSTKINETRVQIWDKQDDCN